MINGRFRLDLPQEGGLTDEERRVLKRWADSLPFAFTEPPTRYTPRWYADATEITIGNGDLYGYYARFGPLVFCQIDCFWGSTSNLNGGSGVLKWSVPDHLPFANALYSILTPIPGQAMALVYGGAWYPHCVVREAAPDNLVLMMHASAANPSTLVQAGVPVPMDPANAWSLSFVYMTTLGLTDR